MSLQTPTTKEINDSIIAQVEASLGQKVSLLPKSFTRVLVKAIAAVYIILYKYAGSIHQNMFVQTASIADTDINGVIISPLVEMGRQYGVGDPIPASNAELTIDIDVTNQSGTLSSGSQLLGDTNGVTYITIGDIELNAAVVQAVVRAVSDGSGGNGSGEIGNIPMGSTLSFANPLPNVDRNTTVVGQTVTGEDGETTIAYRQRVTDRLQKRPQGGAFADYELWGEGTPGIVNVYPYTSTCPGNVVVYSEATVESSGNPDGIPTNSQLTDVLKSIEYSDQGLATRRPAGAMVLSLAISRQGFDVDVVGLSADDISQVEADIQAALVEYFLSRSPFIVGLSVAPRVDRVTVAGVGGAVNDIVEAANGTFIEVVVSTNSVPIPSVFSLGVGQKAKLETVRFV